MTRRSKGIVAGLVTLLLVVTATGCSAITNQLDTRRALSDSGFSSVSVNTSGNDLNVSVSEPTPAVAADDQRVAQIVWGQFHEQFDVLTVTVHGTNGPVSQSFSFEDLRQQLGPRPAAFDSQSIQSAVINVGVVVIAVLGGLFLLAVIIVIIVVVMVRRRRKRNPGFQYGAYPGSPPMGGWPPGPHPGQWPQPYPGGPFSPPQYQPGPQQPPPQYPQQYPGPPPTPPPTERPRPDDGPPPNG